VVAVVVATFLRAPDKAPELFAVVPARDGHVGAIVVQGPQSKTVLNSAYGAMRISGGTQTPSILDASQVREMFGDTIDALPGSAATFTLYFLEGKDELTDESQAQLEDVFAELKRRFSENGETLLKCKTSLAWPPDAPPDSREVAEQVWQLAASGPVTVSELFHKCMVCELKVYQVVDELIRSRHLTWPGSAVSAKVA